MSQEDGQKKKRIAIIGVSTFLLVGMVVAITIGVNVSQGDSNDSKNTDKARIAATAKAVRSFCNPTDYRKECEESLMETTLNTTDPRELIKIAFNITIRKIGSGLKKTDIWHEVEKDPRAKMALETCKQLMDLSIEEFKRSLERIGTFDLNNLDNILTNLKVWLSGAVTYQDTCLDGFENTTSDVGVKMKNLLTSTMHMTSNALAIIIDLETAFLDMNLSTERRSAIEEYSVEDECHHDDTDQLPSWVDDCHGVGVRRLLHDNPHKLKPNLVVAKDGSGKYKSISKALKKVPKNNNKPFVIYIKEGVYREYLEITKKMTHVVFVGDGGNRTRISGNKNFIDGINTYRTPTVAVQGDYFVAINIGFENSAGPHKHQAVAIRVQADKSIFYKCTMDGYQDTLYAHAMRQFYRDCTISGTIDFIFGDAVAVFQNCTFVIRKPLENQQCIVTAQGRRERHQPSGIIIQGGSIVSDHTVKFDNKAYLARPWKNFSRTIFMDTYIDGLIQPDGYMPWQGPQGPSGMNTCFYAEYNNTGPGSDKSKRVKWRGIKTLTSQSATKFIPAKFFHGDDWIRVTRIPYSSGLPRHTSTK
ncbi:Pectinesterase, catalytic [Sesbania bispinosa]|nr:Pectinesterase, catalytic [Sesbania bispinosa]